MTISFLTNESGSDFKLADFFGRYGKWPERSVTKKYVLGFELELGIHFLRGQTEIHRSSLNIQVMDDVIALYRFCVKSKIQPMANVSQNLSQVQWNQTVATFVSSLSGKLFVRLSLNNKLLRSRTMSWVVWVHDTEKYLSY